MNLEKEIEKRQELVNQEMDNLLKEELEELAPNQKELAIYTIMSGGKRLRPFLTMVSAGLYGDEAKALNYGIAAEITHNFTLLHDDIIDEDKYRRGNETLWSKEGLPQALNVGDCIYTLSYKIIAEDENIIPQKRIELISELATGLMHVSEGQYTDVKYEKKYEQFGIDDFIDMVEKKTSNLFIASAAGGAIIGGGRQKDIEHIREYARTMGIAFQIQDDYLDLTGELSEIGKDVGSDIRSGKTTLMVLHALDSLDNKKKTRLKEILQKEDNDEQEIKEAIDMIRDTGGLEHAIEVAKTYSNKARENLCHLPDGENRDILEEFVDFVVERDK